MNTVIISGRLASDPETRYTNSGKAVTNVTLAVDRGYGEKKTTSWIPCVAWEKTAETLANTLTKGRKIIVEGEWTQRSWETNDGQKRRTDECLVHRFEYADSKPQTSGNASADNSNIDVNSFGKDVFPDGESIPF